MKAMRCTSSLLLAATSFAQAQNTPDPVLISGNFTKVFLVVSYVATEKGFCDNAVPASKAASTAALDTWKAANNITQIEQITRFFVQKQPNVQAALDKVKTSILGQIRASAAGQETKFCGEFPALLKNPATQVGQKYKTEISQMLSLMTAKPTAANPTASAPPQGAFKLEPGTYGCTKYKNYNSEADKKQFGWKDTQEDWGSMDLFENGEYSYETKSTISLPSNILDWPKTMGRYAMYYNQDARLNQIDWQTGDYTQYTGKIDPKSYDYIETTDRPTYYVIGKSGNPVIVLNAEDGGFSTTKIECSRRGVNARKTPTQMMQIAENAETYLQPRAVKAAPPPAGSGGLSGVYLGDSPLYLSKTGYVSDGWRWGFDTLDCSRVGLPGGPLQKCGTYQIKGQTVTLNRGKEPKTLFFQKRSNGELVWGDSVYVPITPMKNVWLDGSYSYSWSNFSGGSSASGTQRLILSKDGKFSFSKDSYLAVSGMGNFTTAVFKGQNPNAGTYTLSGYSIVLSFNTGLKLRYSFLLDPNGGAFYLLGNRYAVDK
ncbi:hypothetical protein GCM10022631_32130 [Deinococcus rubellus]|uniref:Uncharacterized protein n=1 Tax=Deinococcus rubellus TaxID=1889240 RepID=A0ABY5YIY0_9DEIO|nr:hypothetical protein [Deinococcus rubellus]UWX65088.1 hypothetical protein N0D28_05370 [Deinococcus rubellus]